MEGILLADKPEGWTSFDVVNYIRRIVASVENKKAKNVKVGHTGTLDPFATGLLIILVGKEYTRRAGEYSKADKTYEVTMRLGQISSTGDPEGEIGDVSDTVPEPGSITACLSRFTGEIKQIPPVYSAVKINGKRAYKLARSGEKFEIEPRKVRIKSIELVDYAYPHVRFKAEVSSGTYIRSLVSDIGEELGVGAYTEQLRRTVINDWRVDDAIAPKELSAENIEQHLYE